MAGKDRWIAWIAEAESTGARGCRQEEHQRGKEDTQGRSRAALSCPCAY